MWSSSGSFGGVIANICLHSIHQEAQLVAERFVAVGHPDVCDVGPSYVVAGWAFLQVVGANEVFLLLWTKRQNLLVCVRIKTINRSQGPLEANVGPLGANVGPLGANMGPLGANIGPMEANMEAKLLL